MGIPLTIKLDRWVLLQLLLVQLLLLLLPFLLNLLQLLLVLLPLLLDLLPLLHVLLLSSPPTDYLQVSSPSSSGESWRPRGYLALKLTARVRYLNRKYVTNS